MMARLVPLFLLICSCGNEPAPVPPKRELEQKSAPVAGIVMVADQPGQQGWRVVAWDATMPDTGALTIQTKDRDGSVWLLSTRLNRVAAGETFRVVFRYRVVEQSRQKARIEVRWELRGANRKSEGEGDVELQGEDRSTISHDAIPKSGREALVPGKWIPLYAVAWVGEPANHGFSRDPFGPDLELRRNGKKVDPKDYARPWLALHLRFEAS